MNLSARAWSTSGNRPVGPPCSVTDISHQARRRDRRLADPRVRHTNRRAIGFGGLTVGCRHPHRIHHPCVARGETDRDMGRHDLLQMGADGVRAAITRGLGRDCRGDRLVRFGFRNRKRISVTSVSDWAATR